MDNRQPARWPGLRPLGPPELFPGMTGRHQEFGSEESHELTQLIQYYSEACEKQILGAGDKRGLQAEGLV